MMGISETSKRIQADDGPILGATLFEAPRESKGVVLVNAALGVPRRYYASYATFLAERGFDVLTYDYRGIGESAPEQLRGFEAYMHEFGLKDMPAMIRWVEEQYGDLPLLAIGHSVGGQMIGLAHNCDRISGVLTIASQWPYWRYWQGRQKFRLALLWYVLIPAITPLLGYFPSRRFGLGENLPRGVAWEWSRWARMPGYLFDDSERFPIAGYERFTAPWRAYSFSDDEFAPPRTVDALLDAYPNAPSEHVHISPAETGARSIGHFGFFRPKFRETLWPQSAEWLEQCAARDRGGAVT